jgi:hypothetical protein
VGAGPFAIFELQCSNQVLLLDVISFEMNRRAKLFSAILNNPRDVRFSDACRVAEALGFVGRQKGSSHKFYAMPGEVSVLNFQDRNGRIPPYQALQLVAMIRKYGESDAD